MQNYLRNLAYLGTYFTASNSGMLTYTFQKVSKIPCSFSFFFDLANLLVKENIEAPI